MVLVGFRCFRCGFGLFGDLVDFGFLAVWSILGDFWSILGGVGSFWVCF